MKKMRFYYLAVAVMTVMCFTACNDKKDDDNNDNGNKPSAIVTPKFAEQACVIKPSQDKSFLIKSEGKKLNSIEFAESGKVYVELQDEETGEKTLVNGNYTHDDTNGFTITPSKPTNGSPSGKSIQVRGSLKELAVKASPLSKFMVDLTIILPLPSGNDLTLTMKTSAETALEAVKEYGPKNGDTDVFSTWQVRGITIELDDLGSDNDFYKDFPAGSDGVALKDILKEAKEQGVKFTADEEKPFQKTVQFVSVTASRIYIDYADGTSDGATWNWVNTTLSNKINMKLLEEGMGNKFIVDDPSVGIEFAKDKGYLNISLNANVSGNKSYKAKLVLRLSQIAEVK